MKVNKRKRFRGMLLSATIALVFISVLMGIFFVSGCGEKTKPVPVTVTEEKEPDLDTALSAMRASDANPVAKEVVELTLQHMDKPYVWGGNGPDSFDCSGLVKYVFQEVGIEIPRVTYDQVHAGMPVEREQLETGDLIFFHNNDHVGIYVSDGIIIHAFPGSIKAISIKDLEKSYGPVSACRRTL